MVADEPPSLQVHSTLITTDDPLEPAAGASFSLAPLRVRRPDVGEMPVGATNPEYFDGALLTVGFQYGSKLFIEGSAVMVGMGIALTVGHIFDDHWDAIHSGEAVVIVGGIRTGNALDAWHCYSIARDGGDLAVMSLKLVSAPPPKNVFSTLPLTTRVPVVGEPITIVGFRFEKPEVHETDVEIADLSEVLDGPLEGSGTLYVSHGAAGDFTFPRHSSLRPFASIDVLAGSLGGMSGGAVLDSSGAVLGVLSKGYNDVDYGSVSFAAWWLPTVNFRLNLTWPLGFYENNPAVLMEAPGLKIYGREFIYYDQKAGGYQLRAWASLPTIEPPDP